MAVHTDAVLQAEEEQYAAVDAVPVCLAPDEGMCYLKGTGSVEVKIYLHKRTVCQPLP